MFIIISIYCFHYVRFIQSNATINHSVEDYTRPLVISDYFAMLNDITNTALSLAVVYSA